MKEFLIILMPVFFLVVAEGCRAAPAVPAIVAHRGASQDAPENTLAAFKLGFEQGADFVEGDFRMTSDGHILAMHDRTLSRTTGDTREINQTSLMDVRSLSAGDWGSWKGGDFQTERVPTLSEVLAIIPAGGGILLEIKDSDRIVPALVRELERSGIGTDRITVIAFDRTVVESLKKVAPKWKALWLTSFSKKNGSWRPDVDEVIDVAMAIGADGVDLKAEPEVVDQAFVDRVKSAGLEIHVWTVNETEIALQMRSLGIDSITTDCPAVIIKAFDQ